MYNANNAMTLWMPLGLPVGEVMDAVTDHWNGQDNLLVQAGTYCI